jgi:hypothetical protein
MARTALDTRRSVLFFSTDFIVVDDAARMCTDIPSTEVSAWTNAAQHPLSPCPCVVVTMRELLLPLHRCSYYQNRCVPYHCSMPLSCRFLHLPLSPR